jgi:sterol desaturase/sphingolipid hydroxylase (fatty acid hydroxylase superfamily)
VNLAISALTFVAAVGLLQPTVHAALRWSAGRSIGFVHLVALPGPIEFVLSLLLMDLTFYYWHLANHRVPILWRFHCVHHIDPDLDVSTAFRFHFGEITLSTAFSLLQVMPFRKQRNYWIRPDGTPVERQILPPERNPARLAE